MSDLIDDMLREELSRVLPDAIKRAIESYENFIQESDFEKAKEFSAHHAACKAAVTHLELLLKLARWINITDSKDNVELQNNLLRAQENIKKHEHKFKQEGKNKK